MGLFSIGSPIGPGTGTGKWKPALKPAALTDPRGAELLQRLAGGVSFAGQVALITGVASSQAIAHRTAANFLSGGGTVVGVDVQPLGADHPLAQAAKAGGGKLIPVTLDQSDFGDLDQLWNALKELKLKVRHCVPFAGLNNPKLLSRVTPDDLRRVVGVNVLGVYYMAGQWPRLAEETARWKVVLPLSPNDGRLMGSGIYPATKKALEPLVIQGQAEMGDRVKPGRPGGDFIGIRMGWVRSNMMAALDQLSTRAREKGLYIYEPQEMGEIVTCLLTPAADKFGGSVFDATGGFGALSVAEFAAMMKG